MLKYYVFESAEKAPSDDSSLSYYEPSSIDPTSNFYPSRSMLVVISTMVRILLDLLILRLSDFEIHADMSKLRMIPNSDFLFERYPSMVLFFSFILENLSSEYILARNQFLCNHFDEAAKTIERISHFENNLSFLFLWGYSKYMVRYSIVSYV